MAKKTNCVKNGTPYYRISAVIGHKVDGKPIRKEFYGSCKAEAENQRDKYLSGLKNGLVADADRMTVGQLFKVWLYEVKRMDSKLKASSFCRYETVYRNHICDTNLMTLPLVKITSLEIQRCLNAMAKSDDSYSTMRESFKVLKMFFNYAVDVGYIVKYPCRGVKLPGEKPKKQKIEVFTDDEIGRIKETLQGHRLRLLLLLALGTGMRKGELLALHYEDIDDGVVHVHRSLAAVTRIDEGGGRKREMTIWEPKTEGSIRDIPIPTELMKEIHLHKIMQMEERLKSGLRGRAKRLFETVTGNVLEESNLNRAYIRILRNANVPYKKFHTLRHTYATKLIQRGVDIKTVQELMGHSDIAITMIYLHPDMNTKTAAAAALNEMFL